MQERVDTLPDRRKEQFKRIVQYYQTGNRGFIYNTLQDDEVESVEESIDDQKLLEIQEQAKAQLLQYLSHEKIKRKNHRGSKGMKHRDTERTKKYINQIVEKIDTYGINYPLLFKEIYGTQLEERTSDYIGICPCHRENSPSLHISKIKGCIMCFGCGNRGGSIISFLQMTLELSFFKAVGKVEKYIMTPEEHKEFVLRNTKPALPPEEREKVEKKKEFIEYLEENKSPKLTKREFKVEFEKYWQRKEKGKNNPDNNFTSMF